MIHDRFVRDTSVRLTWSKRVTQTSIWCLNVLLFTQPMETLALTSWDCSLLYLNVKIVQAWRAIFIAIVTDEWFFLACIRVKLLVTSSFLWWFFSICGNYGCFYIFRWITGHNSVLILILIPCIGRWSASIIIILSIPASLWTLIWPLMELYHEFSIFFIAWFFKKRLVESFTYNFFLFVLAYEIHLLPISMSYSIQSQSFSLEPRDHHLYNLEIKGPSGKGSVNEPIPSNCSALELLSLDLHSSSILMRLM